MVANPASRVEDVLNRMDDGNTWTADWKYDGVRIQIHIGPECERVYSRNLRDVTQKYPEAIQMAKSCLRTGVASVIFDAEVVAVARCGRLLPFQDLSKRPAVATKTGDGSTKEVHVFVFDCMFLNGESLLDQALADRRTRLADALQFEDGHPLKPAASRQFSSAVELEEALEASIADATEGLIAKRLSAAYEPGKRSNHWLKLKKDYLQESICDSIDAVVVGAWHGKGRRGGMFGSFLLAVLGDEGEMQTLCRVGTGLTLSELRRFHAAYADAAQDEAPAGLEKLSRAAQPDKWIAGGPVWELRGADLTVSSMHSCASGLLRAHEAGGSPKGRGPQKGLALRFPRVVRMRDPADKDVSEATTAKEVLRLFRLQASTYDAAEE
jgi:DNA ligase-1